MKTAMFTREAKATSKKNAIWIFQTEAKNDFLNLCRGVADSNIKAYVKLSNGLPFMTITSRASQIEGPTATVSAQFFKDNFSRCSWAVRSNMAFKLTLRNSDKVVYVRRHTAFTDPLDPVIKSWQNELIESKLKDKAITRQLAELTHAIKEGNTIADDANKKLMLGLARLAIGHKPYSTGEVDLPTAEYRLSE